MRRLWSTVTWETSSQDTGCLHKFTRDWQPTQKGKQIMWRSCTFRYVPSTDQPIDDTKMASSSKTNDSHQAPTFDEDKRDDEMQKCLQLLVAKRRKTFCISMKVPWERLLYKAIVVVAMCEMFTAESLTLVFIFLL